MRRRICTESSLLRGLPASLAAPAVTPQRKQSGRARLSDDLVLEPVFT